MFFKNILKFTSILTILFLITCLLFSIIKPIGKEIIDFIDSTKFIILFILILCTISYILCKCRDNLDKTNTLKKNKLFDDETDKEFNADKVVGLKNIINSHEGNKFFSLALIGDWGSGKSSFLRKLEDKINDEKKDIVIYLNVWELENIQNILQEIEKEFDDIILKFSKKEWIIYHLKGILVRNYFSILSKYFVENSININLPFSNTIKDSKDEYNSLLKRVLQDKKIVLILDELDRLESKADVVDIFKVIRYLTSFDKVFTITGLDINKLPEGIELDYTHKIFNSKYAIPKTTRAELLNFLREKGSEQQSDFIKEEEFNEILNTNIGSIDLCLIDFITNYREAKSILNDTYIFCNSLNDNSKFKDNWNKFIDFEFILVLNILKSVNLELYLKFMNENERMQLLIMNSQKPSQFNEPLAKYDNGEKKSTLSEKEKKKVDDFLEYELTAILNNLKSRIENLSQNLYVYTHQNIYDYMFTEDEYNKFVEDTGSIKEKIKSLNNIQISHDYKPNDNKLEDNFIILLIQRLYDEEDKSNRLKVIETIFEDKDIKYSLEILIVLIESYYTLNVMEELFKFNLNKNSLSDENNKPYIDSFMIKIISRDKTNALIKLLFNQIKGTSYEENFKNDLLRFKYISENKDKLIELHNIINTILGEGYNQFFKDEEEYYIWGKQNELKYKFGKDIKKMINENTKLQEEFKSTKN
ncbi:P-loop NTPase fold protein [Aliarcobacter butzleri]|uniref:P-loop NTPase fold protein n=1 Tax=Aliarcobacter butzleri TaxID=28197 RepID=A0AAW7Q2W1_9BACT|nr:P-loop NTPase fold protein [Aliarcobacter butzleri]MDN5113849.1 P-loop NTPase fold protein [Aliarcobacter butzleri]